MSEANKVITKVFTLLSGGVDSSTTLAVASNEFPDSDIECISFDYGQRHNREMASAAKIARHYNASHVILPLKGMLSGMLVDKGENNEEIPNVGYGDLAPGISPTYVSFRNGTMLALLAARAQAWVMAMEQAVEQEHLQGTGPDPESYEAVLYCGVHADDGVNWAYPDCTPEFIGSMANAIYVGTYHKVRLRAPLQYLNKAAVVDIGLLYQVPFHLTWSCYKGEDKHCGTCPTCRSRKEAFAEHGAERQDVEYAA